MLTKNEKKVLRLLFTAFDSDYSINNVAQLCGLSPNGAIKILKKLEEEGVLKARNIANIKSYGLNFENRKTELVLEFALIPELDGRLKHRMDDLEGLKKAAEACILFGSYINLNKNPNDMDVLFILEKNNFKKYKKMLFEIKETLPVKVHDVLQTKEDLKKNIMEKDKVILDILKKGIILWGQKEIVEAVKHVYTR